MTRQRLGKGLRIPEGKRLWGGLLAKRLAWAKCSNPFQPRRAFDDEVEQLASP